MIVYYIHKFNKKKCIHTFFCINTKLANKRLKNNGYAHKSHYFNHTI